MQRHWLSGCVHLWGVLLCGTCTLEQTDSTWVQRHAACTRAAAVATCAQPPVRGEFGRTRIPTAAASHNSAVCISAQDCDCSGLRPGRLLQALALQLHYTSASNNAAQVRHLCIWAKSTELSFKLPVIAPHPAPTNCSHYVFLLHARRRIWCLRCPQG